MISTEKKKCILSFIQETIFAPLLFLSCFVIMALMIFFDVMHVDAETYGGGTNAYTNKFTWQMYGSAGSYYYDYDVKIYSELPIYGYYATDARQKIYLKMVDTENKQWYHLSVENSATNGMFTISATMDSTSKTDPENTSRKIDVTNTELTNNLIGCVTPTADTQGYFGTITCALFDCEDSFLNFVETGSLDGLVKESDIPDERDFGTEYDKSVPVPKLKNLTHNGFTVANASDDLELDLVVESGFYGLKHSSESSFISKPDILFVVDKSVVYASHRYDCTANNEVGFTGSTVVLHEDPFNCKNRLDLFNDGISYFMDYPSHADLPDFNTWKHDTVWNHDKWESYVSLFNGANSDYESALKTTGQAFTKYYVRFYQYKTTDTGLQMIPGQWYCYTYSNDSSVIVSPIEGGNDGDPIETNPIVGGQDGGGNIIQDPGIGGISIDTGNPMTMLSGFLDFIIQLPQLLGGLSSFLAEAFVFIPETFWNIIFAGIGFSVLFLVFRAIK